MPLCIGLQKVIELILGEQFCIALLKNSRYGTRNTRPILDKVQFDLHFIFLELRRIGHSGHGIRAAPYFNAVSLTDLRYGLTEARKA